MLQPVRGAIASQKAFLAYQHTIVTAIDCLRRRFIERIHVCNGSFKRMLIIERGFFSDLIGSPARMLDKMPICTLGHACKHLSIEQL